MVRYFFAAAGSAVVLPAVEKIGVGWFSTISSIFLVVVTAGVYCTALWGESWRDKIDSRAPRETEKVPDTPPVQSAEAGQRSDEKTATA
jgi:hypothetical protein